MDIIQALQSAMDTLPARTLKDCQPGDEVLIRARVVRADNGGQVLCEFPGIGNQGQWSMANSVRGMLLGHRCPGCDAWHQIETPKGG